ncbi:hypothetical protein [Ruegeria sp. ANG-R]|uniref:hypothetical protein n=1 Tax=Ruegeria sp. ANG-R TaxID=1577903 RepID=UPI001269D409|nr:hypothetical protein [Ruegeria sp. ANG-R]
MNRILFPANLAAGAALYLEKNYQRLQALLVTAADIFAIDGGTIDHGGGTFRPIGFHAPEFYPPKREAARTLGLNANSHLVQIADRAVTPKPDKKPKRTSVNRSWYLRMKMTRMSATFTSRKDRHSHLMMGCVGCDT